MIDSAACRPAAPEGVKELLRWLPALTRLELTLEAAEPVALPAWTGSALHGALGWALAEVSCSELCASHHQREPDRCPQARLFDVTAVRPGLSPYVVAMPVAALALRPPSPLRPSVLRPRERWSFGIHLFGDDAIADVRPLLAAVARLAERGIGKGRGRARLISVVCDGREVWENGRLAGEPVRVAASEWAPLRAPAGVRLSSRTPIQLRHAGALDEAPSFERIVEASVRRLVALAAHRGGGEPEVHARDLARELCGGTGPAWARWERFSTTRWCRLSRCSTALIPRSFVSGPCRSPGVLDRLRGCGAGDGEREAGAILRSAGRSS